MAQWISFQLIERPYYDAQGRVLASIEGRKNRKGIDEFTGGGKVYQNLKAVKVLERYEKGTTLLVLVEGEQADIDALLVNKSVTYAASPTTSKTVPEGFQALVLTVEGTEAVKRDVFGISPPVDIKSGVTN